MAKEKVTVFWFRRDLRCEDNMGLHHALRSGYPVLPLFIFDDNIISELPVDDHRLGFIYDELRKINSVLVKQNSSLLIQKGDPLSVFNRLAETYDIQALYFNKDFEPYGLKRDEQVTRFLANRLIPCHRFKDHVIFEPGEVLKSDGKPYTVYTPFKKVWLKQLSSDHYKTLRSSNSNEFFTCDFDFPESNEMGFTLSSIKVHPYRLNVAETYGQNRNFPAKAGASFLGPHLRFGTVSVRQVIREVGLESQEFINELIWREFFIHILFHFPAVINDSFKKQYIGLQWRNNLEDFERWSEGKTGFPMVDAGMRQLNQTGYMHNRVRMVTASFLTKHLLIDWRWGEGYFAQKLLDFELASNNGNWQWAAGTGCDAAPYFRVFNPQSQQERFDPDFTFIRQWIPEWGTSDYPSPMVDHASARRRALAVYGLHLQEQKAANSTVSLNLFD